MQSVGVQIFQFIFMHGVLPEISFTRLSILEHIIKNKQVFGFRYGEWKKFWARKGAR